MKRKSIMVIAGEASGDMLAAELVTVLREQLRCRETFEPGFFGAGGTRMSAAGVEVVVDMAKHSVIGLVEVLKKMTDFRRLFHQLLELAVERQPDLILCVDYSGFNRRFAHAVRRRSRTGGAGPFNNWRPKIVQYVSPQVWASREGRAWKMAKDYDLLLAIFPFEKDWYAKRVPRFRVEFVGHPMLDRHAEANESPANERADGNKGWLSLALLPGSRPGELNRHLPVMLGALRLIQQEMPTVRAHMVLPDESLVALARSLGLPDSVEVQVGDLPGLLSRADVAIASTGTVTMECAFFGVPTVALYKTSWGTYQVGKRVVKVKYLAMPNILANEPLLPEFIQNSATPSNLSAATLRFLRNPEERERVRSGLRGVVHSLGGAGANRRAAAALVELLHK